MMMLCWDEKYRVRQWIAEWALKLRWCWIADDEYRFQLTGGGDGWGGSTIYSIESSYFNQFSNKTYCIFFYFFHFI